MRNHMIIRNSGLAVAATVALVVPVLWLSSVAFADEWTRISPYSGIRWAGDKPLRSPQVLLGDSWFELRAIDGHSVASIIDFCRKTYGDRAEKRFAEDIYDVLIAMGIDDPQTVDLTLAADDEGQTVVARDVPMTHDKRQQLMRRRWAAARAPAERWTRVAPYSGVRWTRSPIVRVNGQWYELLAINDRSVGDILAFCGEHYGDDKAEKRFTEDIYDVLVAMGIEDPKKVDLKVRPQDGGEVVVLREVEMTGQKRREARNLRVD